MSFRVVIRTMRFCTNGIKNLLYCLDLLNLKYSIKDEKVLVNGQVIYNNRSGIYMEIESINKSALAFFHQVNSKLAEIENLIKKQKNQELEKQKQTAQADAEAYRVRQLKVEQKKLARESELLELEKENYVNAKKIAIITKAKEKGYSVQEEVENGVVKLKLIKRIY